MRILHTVASCVLFLAACDQDNVVDDGPGTAQAPVAAEPAPTGGGAGDSAVPSSGHLFGEETGKDPCTLLTAEMVAAVAEQDPGSLTQRNTSGMCIYKWKGATPGKASIAFIRTHKTQEEAASRFAVSHKNMSGEQVAGAMKAVGEGAKNKLKEDAAAGKKVPDPKMVEPVTKELSDNSMGGGINFESVAGIGDEAVFQTTRHETKFGGTVIASYANKLELRVDNLEFDVSFSFKKKSAEAEPVMYKAQCVALARAVLTGLEHRL